MELLECPFNALQADTFLSYLGCLFEKKEQKKGLADSHENALGAGVFWLPPQPKIFHLSKDD